MLTTQQWLVVLAAVAIVVVALIALVASRSSKRRHAQLKQRFGPEYERAVAQHGSEDKADRELIAREKRIHKLHLRALPETERVQFSEDWRNVQARFVDDPSGAVQAADDLIQAVMLARGYSSKDFDQRVEDLSVEHASVIEHYRSARELAEANREGRANTEELRQAFVHYRALFADVLDQKQAEQQPTIEQEVHAS
jgi:hypothetical protein